MERGLIARQATEEDYLALHDNRLELKMDMQKVLGCFSAKEKHQLVDEWKRKYSKRKVEELIRFAKNKKVCYAIAHWDVEHFKRTRK